MTNQDAVERRALRRMDDELADLAARAREIQAAQNRILADRLSRREGDDIGDGMCECGKRLGH